ncbi:hydroxyacylglutathione hydrolase [Anaerobaca lacustris]|uniref:Hydroxyacylglutathione hydrolase n=1 Tax=Anaerobaca lacustris TaxID=3044600 RepID=A0AAW6U2W3_9BACT|nr:hydroxyacylglutathione hydrolase [Sedimentisphaerales bacterium M17dextr]
MMDSEPVNAIANATTILTCGDNYTYICLCGERCAFVVDPTDAAMVLRVLDERRLTLTAALLTHHHADHTAGLAELKSATGCQVVGPDARRIVGIDRLVRDGDTIELGDRTTEVLATPGHTRTSVCYYLPASPNAGPGSVFTGDTLFVGGCGRPLECDAHVLWASLQRLAALPEETLVWCGHDYTAENYEFALTIEPDNQAVRERLNEIRRAAAEGRPSVPSTIACEKATNVFLRAGDSTVRAAVGVGDANSERTFAELRRRKNLFG